MSVGRGFDFEGISKESTELLLWMARNRLNVSGYRPATGPLGAKLGMRPKNGGHIFEEILDPDRVLPTGRTHWEEHAHWYGLPANGIRHKERALKTQFCVAQTELLDYLGEELLHRVNGVWIEADRIDIWGFDTWGTTCSCPDCQGIGNNAVQAVALLTRLREALDQARADGRLDHDVRLVMCAYEGTATLTGPEHPIPGKLIRAGDCVVFYPINRCYAHDLTDTSCSINSRYAAALASWGRQTPSLPIILGEYYNVSKFEDLPLLFTTRIAHDLRAYHRLGVRGMTYMHVPLVNWGQRALTQVLYAQLAWDVETDVDKCVDNYFAEWYGPHAACMRGVYERVEEAWKFIASWRSWHASSVLSQLLLWDGRKPQQELSLDDHLGSPASAVVQGRRSIALLQEALALVDTAGAAERARATRWEPDRIQQVANPLEAHQDDQFRYYEYRLGEDRRLLIYGVDTMMLMTEMVAYYDTFFQGETTKTDAHWNTIEHLADRLDAYYMPISFQEPGAGLDSKDAFTRTSYAMSYTSAGKLGRRGRCNRRISNVWPRWLSNGSI
jgi:hypothetical protein